MERTVWTDERLDDRFTSIDRRFDEVIGELRELRTEVRELRAGVHRDLLHLTIGMIGAFTALFAALVAGSL